ncbi:hypothetical protein G7B40_024065 [Aetokthonos hydrillicola Thurmond2011]|jgi:hypothetical protein|uniref:Uncharacterized protein n=1 Tax=Aetokthonos hydrillicola Thurmond2011 TaxID=2712845 RepID=A0AAP5MC53_9CYAN|nr:hypothetical protein [Aetokthonos hydrillicola]MBO3464041.1 hypothetical protein [Aetokthonos hydrillicola CCALA 1050]MBW4586906.1 hypothetical protein [Aetokthonos hydrillicola CCALA 1050]MDR9897619.1 hypothetical protein [Aetokthonos hydrillicola Thurmond2011]
MRKTTFLTLSLVFLGIVPGMAQLVNIVNTKDDSQLGKVWTQDFQNYALDLQTYLASSTPSSLKPIELFDTQAVINSSTGELNIPNPIEAGKNVRFFAVQKSISGTFENNPSLEANTVSNEFSREITRGAVEGVLGRNGQTRIKQKLEDTEDSLKEITKSIKDLKDNQNFITQAINKTISTACNATNDATGGAANASACQNAAQTNLQLQAVRIQGEQAKMLGETFAQTMYLNQSLQYSNLNLANVAQQLEETNRARRVDTSAEAARLVRVTSQLDLLGRETQQEEVNQQQQVK